MISAHLQVLIQVAQLFPGFVDSQPAKVIHSRFSWKPAHLVAGFVDRQSNFFRVMLKVCIFQAVQLGFLGLPGASFFLNYQFVASIQFWCLAGDHQHDGGHCVHGEQRVRQPQVRGGGDGSLLRQVSVQV